MGKVINPSRREFLKQILGIFILIVVFQNCKKKIIEIIFRITGTNKLIGHRLITMNFPKVSDFRKSEIIIIGAGISGLSAGREFSKNHKEDYLILELDSKIGGNSAFGENKYSKYPLGAHYLPLPNLDDKHLLNFLTEEKIIIGYDENDVPIFDTTQLTFSPQERLYIHNNWQEDLVPNFGMSQSSLNEIERFMILMNKLKNEKGSDGKYHFNIPIKNISKDLKYREYDNLCFGEWLKINKFSDENLLIYLNYCCKDDFGIGINEVSAWAGIHYFTARKNLYPSKYSKNVLTWPNGNGNLAQLLANHSKGKILLNQLVYDVKSENGKTKLKVFDALKNISISYETENLILATPQYVNNRIFNKSVPSSVNSFYNPWIVANITLSEIPYGVGEDISWDNVIFKGKGLGYIYNQNQSLKLTENKFVITYYSAIEEVLPEKRRKFVYSKNEDYWKQYILNDLKIAHKDIENLIESIELTILGHGMISPRPGYIFKKEKYNYNISDNIYFAHTDLVGISIFEEAFHIGRDTALKIINSPNI